MGPGFDKKTKDTLAKCAAYKCSNPSCGVLTVGPNSQADKVTNLGQAAHIFGARASSARFRSEMTDATRAEITNGIWLCGNCHKKIDDDEQLYPADTLFRWREAHQQKISAELGNPEAKIQAEQEQAALAPFGIYPPIVRRIVIDKPPCWEWRLTAELMRHLNAPDLRRMDDLRNGLYSGYPHHIHDDDILDWVSDKCREMESLIAPLSNLAPRLSEAWGKLGEEGNAEEILHITVLIRDALARVVDHEEDLYFAVVGADAKQLTTLLKDAVGRQISHYEAIPAKLDEVAELAIDRELNGYDAPIVIQHDIVFDLPKNWTADMKREMRKFTRNRGQANDAGEQASSGGCLWAILIGLVMFFFVVSAG